MLWGRWGKRKRELVGNDGKGEERPLPYNVRFSGWICGSVVLAKPADYLDACERCCEDNREFKIRSLPTTDYGNTWRGPGSRFTAHAR